MSPLGVSSEDDQASLRSDKGVLRSGASLSAGVPKLRLGADNFDKLIDRARLAEAPVPQQVTPHSAKQFDLLNRFDPLRWFPDSMIESDPATFANGLPLKLRR